MVYIEYQSFCPFVGIGSLHPLPRKRVWLPSPGPKLYLQSSELGPTPPAGKWVSTPFGSWGGGGHNRLRERGWGGLHSDEGADTPVLYESNRQAD
jgi:hypothetical protein